MKVILHPYKGYLNTEFYIFAEGGTQNYSIFSKGETEESIMTGVVHANALHKFKLSQPGEFTVVFEDGTTSNIIVEDGYKFGGGKLKKAFIFDNCPWAFIIMHDRTYFYNRETEQAYVEPLSPDNIIEITKDYVTFENTGDPECTLFSLIEQSPVLCVRNIVSFNESILIWTENTENQSNEYLLKVYSLTFNKVTTSVLTTSYCVDEKSHKLFYVDGKEIKCLSLELNESLSNSSSFEYEGDSVAFINSQIFVSHLKSQNIIYVYNLLSGEKIGVIKYDGILAELNNVVFAQIEKQRQAIYKFNLEDVGFGDCNITGKFTKLYFYPCAWDVFYLSTTTDIFKSKVRNSCATRSLLKSMNDSRMEVALKKSSGRFCCQGNAICFYNDMESYVMGKFYQGSGYNESGRVFVGKHSVVKQKGGTYTRLSRNGYWDHSKERDLDFSYYEEFGVIKDKNTSNCEMLNGRKLGKWICRVTTQYATYVKTGECIVIRFLRYTLFF